MTRSTFSEDSDVVKQQLLRDPTQRFQLGHNTSAWAREVDTRTPSAFREAVGSGAALCNPSQALLSAAQLAPGAFDDAEAAAGLRALRESGFVLLDDFFSAEATDAPRAAYTLFRDDASGGAAPFRYPVQGAGRVEHMLRMGNDLGSLLFRIRTCTYNIYTFLGAICAFARTIEGSWYSSVAQTQTIRCSPPSSSSSAFPRSPQP